MQRTFGITVKSGWKISRFSQEEM